MFDCHDESFTVATAPVHQRRCFNGGDCSTNTALTAGDCIECVSVTRLTFGPELCLHMNSGWPKAPIQPLSSATGHTLTNRMALEHSSYSKRQSHYSNSLKELTPDAGVRGLRGVGLQPVKINPRGSEATLRYASLLLLHKSHTVIILA